MSNNSSKRVTWGHFTDWDLKHACELMIRPEWLLERGALIALLKAFDFNAQDAMESLIADEPLNDGPKLCLSWLYQFCINPPKTGATDFSYYAASGNNEVEGKPGE